MDPTTRRSLMTRCTSSSRTSSCTRASSQAGCSPGMRCAQRTGRHACSAPSSLTGSPPRASARSRCTECSWSQTSPLCTSGTCGSSSRRGIGGRSLRLPRQREPHKTSSTTSMGLRGSGWTRSAPKNTCASRKSWPTARPSGRRRAIGPRRTCSRSRVSGGSRRRTKRSSRRRAWASSVARRCRPVRTSSRLGELRSTLAGDP
mmetsp:Transcript_22550/g.57485  ORF Transcript_22550/g.57485 Transcript_22550/m.57485 type:complete len:203 (-) Transcript_22550:207-815(-)